MADSKSLDFEGGLVVEQTTINWKIQNFDAVRQFKDLISAQKLEFFAGETIGLPTNWGFHLQLQELESSSGGSDAKTKWIGVFCRPLSPPPNAEKFCVQFTMQITSKLNTKRFNYQSFRNFGTDSRPWGYATVIKQDTKLEDLHLNEDGALTLQIDFKLYAVKAPNLDIQEVQNFEVESLKILSQDLSGSSDGTVLVSKEGVEFPSNRGVLSARSAVFRQMFQAEMKESITGRVKIEDLSSKTLAILNTYMLTGKLDGGWKSDEIIKELLYGIHKYQLEHLIGWMDKILGKVCTKETAKGLVILAEKFGMKKAERDLVEFIRKYAVTAEEITLISIQSAGARKEGLKRKEVGLRKQEAELKRKEAMLKKKEGQLKNKDAKLTKKEGPLKRKEVRLRKKGEEQKRKEVVLRKKREGLKKRAEKLKSKETKLKEKKTPPKKKSRR